MVIKPTIPHRYSIVSSLSTYDRRPRLSRAAGYALTGAVVAHLALGLWLYNQHWTPTRMIREQPDPAPVIIDLSPPAPEPSKPHPLVRQMDVHRSTPLAVKMQDVLPVRPVTTQDVSKDFQKALFPVDTLVDQTPAQTSEAKPRVITDPAWQSRPSAEEMAREYPVRALELGKTGQAMLHCTVTLAGTLNGCAVSGETPANYGFGAAALKLSKLFRMTPRTEDGQPVDGAEVNILLRFTLPG
jgi:protein TonB